MRTSGCLFVFYDLAEQERCSRMVEEESSASPETGKQRFLPHVASMAHKFKEEIVMEFFNSAVGVLQTLVIALGAGLGIWGAINLLEGYGNDNPGANAHVR